MENLLYIIIGIAWVAYSLYSARQKALQKQQSAGLPPSGPSPSSPLPIPGNQGGGKTLFEDIFREITGEPKPVPQAIKPVIREKPEQPKTVSELNNTYEDYSDYKFATGMQSNFVRTVSENELQTQEKYELMTKNEGSSKKIDLREAVILSELLNRKYF